MRNAIHILMPKEHALWSWVGVPLFGSVILAPGWSTVFGSVAAMAAFGVFNGASRVLRSPRDVPKAPLIAATVVAIVAGLVGATMADRGGLMIGVWVAAGVGCAGLLAWTGGKLPKDARMETLGIGGFAGLGGAHALAAGATWEHAVMLAALTTAWG